MTTNQMTIEDLGVTYLDGDYSERTLIVRGSDFSCVVLLDRNGKVIISHESFDIDGIENWESVARDAAHGLEICEAAEAYLADK